MVEVVWSLGYINGQLKTLYLSHKHVPLVHYLARIEDIYKIMSSYVKIHEKNSHGLDASFFNNNILSNDVVCFIKNEASGQIFYYDFIRDFYHFLSYHEHYKTNETNIPSHMIRSIDNKLKFELDHTLNNFFRRYPGSSYTYQIDYKL